MLLAFVNKGQIVRYPISGVELRRMHPRVSFPARLDAVDLSAFGVVAVRDSPQPAVDRRYEKITEDKPVLIEGEWRRSWRVDPLSELERKRSAENVAFAVRNDRNQRLANCDWTQLADAPVDAAPWAAYRQALRDVPSQAGFPWDVIWPEAPAA